MSNNQYSVNLPTAGDFTIVPALSRQSIQVLRVVLTGGAAATVVFKSNTTALSGAMNCAGLLLDINQNNPWFITAPGEALVLTVNGQGAAGFLQVQYV